MDQKEEFDFDEFKKQAIKSMYDGKPFSGEKGIFVPLMKHFLEATLDGELENHLAESKAIVNRKNGKTSKHVKSLSGEFELENSRDRSGTFEPMILPTTYETGDNYRRT
jgi:transposase-like protein